MWGLHALTRLKAVQMASALLVTLVMSMQIVFLLIGQYTVLSAVHPGVGNWVEITGEALDVEQKTMARLSKTRFVTLFTSLS